MLSPFISLFDFFLPRICFSCKTKLEHDEDTICSECLQSINKVDQQRMQHEFDRKFSAEKIISGFYSLFIFEKGKALQHVIHGLKYNQRFRNGNFLGRLIGSEAEVVFKKWDIDFIIPVPLHPVKKAERGYNQAYYIAKGIETKTHIPVVTNVIKRIKFTQSQTTMNLLERKQNIDGAFIIKNSSKVKGRNVLLIDDVITTGATLSACGKVLLEAEAASVYASSVALAD